MDLSVPPSVLALIPAYNEEKHIGGVVRAAAVHLPVLVVDDGSRDRTAQEARDAGAEVYVQTPNQGKGMALKKGFQLALERRVDGLITLDADGQHDPAEIPLFLEAYEAHPSDLIIGARNFNRMPLVRRLSNKTGSFWFSWAMGCPIRDNQSGYRLLSRRLTEAMRSSKEAGFEFEVDMIALCVDRNWNLDWVPIRTIYGNEESHINPWRHTWEFFRMVWLTRRRMRNRRQSDSHR